MEYVSLSCPTQCIFCKYGFEAWDGESCSSCHAFVCDDCLANFNGTYMIPMETEEYEWPKYKCLKCTQVKQ